MLTEKNMILVDGDEGIRKSLSLFFRARNCNLLTFENATQALKAMKMKHYDIILCDEFLPDMNGLHFFNIISDKYSEAIKILITLYGSDVSIENLKTQSVDYLLTKPFSGDEVEEELTKLLQAKRCNNWKEKHGKGTSVEKTRD